IGCTWCSGPGRSITRLRAGWPGRARRAGGVAAPATSAGARPTRRTPAVPVTPTRAPTFSASPTCRTPTVLFRISPLAWPRWERTSAPALPRVPLRGRCAGETVGSWAERALVPAGSSAWQPRPAVTAHDRLAQDTAGRRGAEDAAAWWPGPAADAVPASGRRDPPDRRGPGAGHRGGGRCAVPCAAPAGCGRDHRGRARDRGRAGADRPGPGGDRGRGAGAAGRRPAVPPVPCPGYGGGRVRGCGGADGRNHRPGRAGRLRRAAPGFLADRRRVPPSGRPRGAGGCRRGRGAVAEPAVAPGGLGRAPADRRGPADHRRGGPGAP